MTIDKYIRRRVHFTKLSESEKRQDISRLNLLLSKYGLSVNNVIEAPTYITYQSYLDVDTKINAVLRLDKNFGIALRDNNVRVYIDGDVLNIEKRGADNEIGLDDIYRCLNPDKLLLMVGIDNHGEKIMCNLAKAPHVLVAGTTGSGKSVYLHSCILSMLIAHTKDIDIIGIDPKGNEFIKYKPLKNFDYVSDVPYAIQTLKRLVDEMELRYDLFAQARVRDIDEYNEKVDTMRRKVCIIDELADLMLTGGKQVEEYIVRLAQKSRACGIHLILATQRPSADIITGLIKTNIPTRVCFAVKSQIDSRIILDEKGGERLNGCGDMLFQSNGARESIRVKGVNVMPEVDNVVAVANYIQRGLPLPQTKEG